MSNVTYLLLFGVSNNFKMWKSIKQVSFALSLSLSFSFSFSPSVFPPGRFAHDRSSSSQDWLYKLPTSFTVFCVAYSVLQRQLSYFCCVICPSLQRFLWYFLVCFCRLVPSKTNFSKLHRSTKRMFLNTS